MSCRCRRNRNSRRREEERNCFRGEFDERSGFDNWEDACCEVEDRCDRDDRHDRCDRDDRCDRGEDRCDRDRDRDKNNCLKEQPRRSNRAYIIGNSVNIDIDRCDTEVKAKIVVKERDSVRIWGQVVDCDNCPVAYALVKLLKEGCNCNFESISHTMTDCNGFYQFDVCPEDQGREFVVLAGKDAESRESVASSGIRDNNCRCLCSKGGPKSCGDSKHCRCRK